MKEKIFKHETDLFHLPVDYELDESEGDLFGIIEIPFDAFSGDSNENISNQSGGANNPCQRHYII